jgi:hypothetical protein
MPGMRVTQDDFTNRFIHRIIRNGFVFGTLFLTAAAASASVGVAAFVMTLRDAFQGKSSGWDLLLILIVYLSVISTVICFGSGHIRMRTAVKLIRLR